MQALLLLLLFLSLSTARAQIGATERQLISRWKGGTAQVWTPGNGYVRTSISFPHGNHGKGLELLYELAPDGTVKAEYWFSDSEFSPWAVLKQSEPGYSWTQHEPRNFFGTAPGKPPLHTAYYDLERHNEYCLGIAPLALVPDKGEGGWEFRD
jgi:hypothetical protein